MGYGITSYRDMKIIFTQPNRSNLIINNILVFRYTIPYEHGKIFISAKDMSCIELWTNNIGLPWNNPEYSILKSKVSH